jgi:hypothetical protein
MLMVNIKTYLNKFLPASLGQKAPVSMTLVTLFDREKYIVDQGKRSLTIGRNESNDIVIPDGRVSKLHCRIDYEEGKGFHITDYSRNGTFICNTELTNIVHLANKAGWFQIPAGHLFLGIHPRSGFNSTKIEFICM